MEMTFDSSVGWSGWMTSFLLSELESVTGPAGLKIERDLYFNPTH